MKPLILLTLVLSVAGYAQAQTIADAARKERERQAKVETTKIFTTEDAKSKDSKAGPEAKPVENPAPGLPPLPGEAAATTPTAEPVVDPLQQWTEEMTKLRARARELMDQETALQLEINNATAAINAPVTSQSAKNQANRNLEAANAKLLVVRAELAKVREEVNAKELQGPPAKK